jgi:hypothetical protein
MKHLLVSLLVLGAFAAPAAHAADPEVESMHCTGSLQLGVLRPGAPETSGRLECTLSHGALGGYEPYATFSSSVTGTVDNRPVDSSGAVSMTSGRLAFAGKVPYTLYFDDVTTGSALAIVNPDDYIVFPSPYLYRVRGFIADVCFGCFSSEGGSAVIDFVAEYVYDLPVR